MKHLIYILIIILLGCKSKQVVTETKTESRDSIVQVEEVKLVGIGIETYYLKHNDADFYEGGKYS